MTDQTTELVKRHIEAFSKGDWETFKGTLGEETEYEEYGTQRHIKGTDETVRTLQAWKEAFPDYEGSIRTLMSSMDDKVAAEVTWHGTHRGDLEMGTSRVPATGREVYLDGVYICNIKDGKIIGIRHYFEITSLLEQLGVREQAA